jgi:hypothetical protein
MLFILSNISSYLTTLQFSLGQIIGILLHINLKKVETILGITREILDPMTDFSPEFVEPLR